jgi:hypothetical protein
MKLVPFTVRVKAAPPAVAAEGESEVIDGTGFDIGGGGEVEVDDEPPQADNPVMASRGTISQR